MLINFSNHPSELWSAEQREAAEKQFGTIVDVPFPAVSPAGDGVYIGTLVQDYFDRIVSVARNHNKQNNQTNHSSDMVAVHIMGEMTFTYAMVKTLKQNGFTCVASTTERVATEAGGVKTSEFRFVQFREYT
jgi:hypothetical protein